MDANAVLLPYNIQQVEQQASSSLHTDSDDTVLDLDMMDDEMSLPPAQPTEDLTGHTTDKIQSSVEEPVGSVYTQPYSPAGSQDEARSRVIQKCHDDSSLRSFSHNSDDEQQRFLHQHSDHSIKDEKNHSRDKKQECGQWKGNHSKDTNNLDHEGKQATSHSLSHHSKNTYHHKESERRKAHFYPQDTYYHYPKEKEEHNYSFHQDYYYSKEIERRKRYYYEYSLQCLHDYHYYMYYYQLCMNYNSQTYRHHSSYPSSLYTNQATTSHPSSLHKNHKHHTTTSYSSVNNYINEVREATSQPHCHTPQHFDQPHTTTQFTSMGQLIQEPGKGNQAKVQVHDVQKTMEKNPDEDRVIHQMKHFPGPLTL